jgi:glycosyltransferase involved in cell wall biosynthesis
VTSPLISVVIPTHNRASLLKKAIDSVLLQTERDLELIIVDDASTDETSELLNEFVKTDARIKVIKNKVALGGGGARNAGIFASKGKWVAFLDDDDEWFKNKLSLQLEKINLSPSAVACSCDYEHNYPFGLKKKFVLPHRITLNELYYANSLGGASMCLCSRNILVSIQGFDTKLKSGQDWDLWVRLRAQGQVVVCNRPLVRYMDHSGFRISNNMRSQYLGSRYFYFKHRDSMDVVLRKFRICHLCFLKSRDTTKNLKNRLHYLFLAVYFSDLSTGLKYLKSSLSRILINK